MISRQIIGFIKLSFLDLYRRKDLFVLLLLGFVLAVPLAMLRPFGQTGATRYMNEIAMLLIWVFSFVIALGSSARLFPPEFESRTIYPHSPSRSAEGLRLWASISGASGGDIGSRHLLPSLCHPERHRRLRMVPAYPPAGFRAALRLCGRSCRSWPPWIPARHTFRQHCAHNYYCHDHVPFRAASPRLHRNAGISGEMDNRRSARHRPTC